MVAARVTPRRRGGDPLFTGAKVVTWKGGGHYSTNDSLKFHFQSALENLLTIILCISNYVVCSFLFDCLIGGNLI
jgi:hypothetical protein